MAISFLPTKPASGYGLCPRHPAAPASLAAPEPEEIPNNAAHRRGSLARRDEPEPRARHVAARGGGRLAARRRLAERARRGDRPVAADGPPAAAQPAQAGLRGLRRRIAPLLSRPEGLPDGARGGGALRHRRAR